jgi:hypothetical protein
METLLVVAIVITTIAVIVQGGALLAMYLLSRHVANNVNGLVNESQKLMAPLQRIAANFRVASEDVAEAGKTARGEVLRAQSVLSETQTAIHDQIQDLRYRITATTEDLQHTLMTPIREWSAIATGIAAAVQSFFGRRKTAKHGEEDIGQKPAA